MLNDQYQNRRLVIGGFIVLVVIIFVIRLVDLQIMDDSYRDKADSNAFLKKIQFPARGLIKDRNGKLVVFNKPAYDIMVVDKELKKLDTVDFCNTIGITKEVFINRMKEIKHKSGFSRYTPQPFIAQLSAGEYGVLQEKLFRFSGIYIQKRTLREYNYPNAALLLGSIGEVNRKTIEKDEYYIPGDFAGQNGIELTYEKVLRGEKGVEILLRDAHGRIQGSYNNGEYDVQSKAGQNLTLSIDIDLQAYGEKLMQNKIGSIAAIDPSTGEILALISSPTYDPSLLVGRQRTKNFAKLVNDPLKPLFDRPMMACYPPGSTFKTANALIFQQEDIINRSTTYGCSNGYHAGSFTVGCHSHVSPLNLVQSIQHSCNAYYCSGFRAMLDNKKYPKVADAFEVWKNHIVSLGFGYKLGADVPNEKRGYIPNSGVYNKIYGKDRWRSLTIISLAIGQGEVLATPLQLANLSATIANRGFYITPHLVKGIEGGTIDSSFIHKKVTTIQPQYFDPVIEGMDLVMKSGTGWGSRIDSIEVCGKTGTAQNPHGEDHSIFMAFAPKDDPKIAICVVVENSGFGATWAAPIATLMMEKYLKGYIPKRRLWLEERMFNANLLPQN
ncbi:MAG TPA: penicillin-binding transpeptidase domain-containing protein [Paludibacteraceae bacterium]|jgi:penicillin-binding protein 2|nr:penicillin-binding transpeptidase domain-containing protein [Paludibacteraceae bacterium]